MNEKTIFVHPDECPYKCAVGAFLRCQQNLYTVKKCYSCYVCKMSFRQKINLKLYMSKHIQYESFTSVDFGIN